MIDRRRTLALFVVLLSTACARDTIEPAAPMGVEAPMPDLSRIAEREIHEPQLLLDADGAPLLVWREKSGDGSDLFVSRAEDGALGEPVRVNDEPGTVESFPHDEMRAAIAVGEAGRLALAWADRRGQVRAALSSDGGRSFEPSIRLDQADAAAYRGFPALTFGPSGALHAIWIDSRHAGGFAEEPADLFYATVGEGEVAEVNLTADQEATVCGCCRTHLDTAAAGEVRSLFRNADAEGYRDIFSTVSREGDAPGPPQRIGQPLWELEGCPMSGPVAVDDAVLWPDGSSGKKVLMVAGFGPEPAEPLFTDELRGDWSPRLSPRSVASSKRALVLLPGRPDTRLVERAPDGGWQIVGEGLPAWATAGLYDSGSLLVVGAVDGELRSEIRRIAG